MFIKGKIKFDPPEYTKKHNRQGAWKKVVIIEFPGTDLDGMWRWYMNKRFGLKLNPPIRKCHVTLINDKVTGVDWNEIKRKYDGQYVNVQVTNRLRSNGEHWWLNVESNHAFDQIRCECLLSDPFYGYHLTIGIVNSRTEQHSKYILRQLIRYDNRRNF